MKKKAIPPTDKLRRYTSWVQAIYTFLTAVWPIVDIKSFMMVSGYKTDRWLVETVSVLLLSLSICILLDIFSKGDHFSVPVLALLMSVSLAYIDFYYALHGTISKIYMADGLAEIVFAGCWTVFLVKKQAP